MNSFKKSFKSEFGRNVATLMGGTVIGQVIPFLSTFILTRIFSPDEFGVFAVYLSLVNILGAISTGRYEMSILLPKTHERAFELVRISLKISLVFCLICFLIIILFAKSITGILETEELFPYIYFLPVSVFGFATYRVFTAWYTRIKKYRKISLNMVIKSISGVFFNIGIGYFFGLIGLFLGNIFSSLIAVVSLGPSMYFKDFQYSKRRMCLLARKYSKFPIYDVPSSFMYTLSKNGIVLLISKGFASAITGYFSLTERVLITPSQVFVGSYTQVYNQRITEKYNQGEDIRRFVIKNVNRLGQLLSLPFAGVLYLSIFYVPWVFGNEWTVLYKYIYILCPYIFFSMLLNPLGYILKILNRQDLSLLQHVILTIAKLGSLLFSIFILDLSIYLSLMIYAILSIAVLSINATMIYNLLEVSHRRRWHLYVYAGICIALTLVNYNLI